MKKILLTLLAVIYFLNGYSQTDRSVFFNENSSFDDQLPFPGDISGHTFGKWHFSHDQQVRYLLHLAENSDKISMWEYGRTHEDRPLYMLAVTSEENQQNLDEIRRNHLKAIEGDMNAGNQPMIIWLGYGVHGNESSPGNAAMLVAYYLSASKSEEVSEMLNSAVILIDPCLNPDGFTRAAYWSNMNAHKTLVTDPNDRQFREDWPGGRTNHYWFDLNRDWLPAQHPESKARLNVFHQWKPHVTTDHHEMGSSSTFFFQPGVPERMNPLTPDKNLMLTRAIAKHHAKALDEIGSLYFSEEGFDDFYYGKGSTYPDVNASIGILFEQSRVLGEKIDNPHGGLTFSDAIMNQFTVSLSTIRGTLANKENLSNYQAEFYQNAFEMADEEEISGYVFGAEQDPVTLYHFIKLLRSHQIKTYRLNKTIQKSGKAFHPGKAYLVPVKQKQYRLVKSLFKKQTHFEDSIFYDISSWTMPLAFNLTYASLDDKFKLENYKGEPVEELKQPQGNLTGGESQVGYIANGRNYNIHSFLYHLKANNLIAKVAAKPYKTTVESGSYHFDNGSVFIPVNKQVKNSGELYHFLKESATSYGVDILSLESGLSDHSIDLGSWNFVPVEKPKILMVAGDGVSSRSAGETWHLLDHRMHIPVVMIKPDRLNRINLFDYNTLIMPDGWYNWDEEVARKISFWVDEGGVLIGMEDANRWLNEQEWIAWNQKKNDKNTREHYLPYADRGDRRRIESVSGVILKASIDPTHPLNYGISNNELPVFKDNNFFIEKTENPYATPVAIEENALMSGYLSAQNKKNISNTAWCLVNRKGRGKIISFVDNPNFRGYWYGTNKVFLNAVFYGRMIR